MREVIYVVRSLVCKQKDVCWRGTVAAFLTNVYSAHSPLRSHPLSARSRHAASHVRRAVSAHARTFVVCVLFGAARRATDNTKPQRHYQSIRERYFFHSASKPSSVTDGANLRIYYLCGMYYLYASIVVGRRC